MSNQIIAVFKKATRKMNHPVAQNAFLEKNFIYKIQLIYICMCSNDSHSHVGSGGRGMAPCFHKDSKKAEFNVFSLLDLGRL